MQGNEPGSGRGNVDFRDAPDGQAFWANRVCGPDPSARMALPVHFGQARRNGRPLPMDATGFAGPGQCIIEGDTITLAGTHGRLMRLTSMDQRRYTLRQVVNVLRQGTAIGLEIEDATGKRAKIRFSALDAQQAAIIQARLPRRCTPDFIQEQQKLREFAGRMQRMKLRAPLTPGLIAINVIVFGGMIAASGQLDIDGATAIRLGSNDGPLTLGGQWWRLFSAMFMHFGVLHLLCNMYALYLGGRVAEKFFGSTRFLLIYLVAGLTGSLASLLWNPEVNSAGASGAIMGIFGAMLAFMLSKRNDVPRAALAQAGTSLMAMAVSTLLVGFLQKGIDNAAHVGGALVGGLLMRPLNEKSRSRIGLPQLALGICGAIALMSAMAWPLLHPSAKTLADRQFQQFVASLHGRETEAIDVHNHIVEQARHHDISRQDYAQALERDELPKWRALYDQVRAIDLSIDDRHYARQQLLIRYLGDRRDVAQFASQAARQNDPRLGALAKASGTDAEQAVTALNALTRP